LLFLHCKTCAIVIGLLKPYLLTYILTLLFCWHRQTCECSHP